MRTKTLMFLITYNCNLRCSYCYEPKLMSARISKYRLQSLIREKVDSITEQYDSFEIHFMGGEPLLEFQLIKEVSEWIWSQKFNKRLIAIYAPTNGTLLNDEIKEWCQNHKNKFCLGLSFDGNESMQDVNRSSSSGQVDLKFFSSTWPRQSVKMTISPKTVSELANGVEYLHSMGFREVVADLAQGKNIGWEPSQLKELSKQLDSLSKFYIENKEDMRFSMLDIDIFGIGGDVDVKTCSCGENLICMDLDGQEYACHLFSPVSIPLEKAKRSQSMDFSQKSNFRSEECQRCILNSLCSHCYGMNFINTDDMTKPEPIHCAAFKIIYIANCRHRLRLAESDNDIFTKERIAKIIDLIA